MADDEKKNCPRAQELAGRYIKAAEALGKPLDGLEASELWLSIVTPETEAILEIVDTIKQYEDMLEQQQLFRASHTHVVSVPTTQQLPLNSSGTPAPSSYVQHTTGGINAWVTNLKD